MISNRISANFGIYDDTAAKHSGENCAGIMDQSFPTTEFSTCSQSDLVEYFNFVSEFPTYFTGSWCLDG